MGLVSTTPWQIFGLHYLARFIFIVSVALMFIGLMKQGYTLSAGDWVVVLVLFTALAAVELPSFITGGDSPFPWGLWGSATLISFKIPSRSWAWEAD